MSSADDKNRKMVEEWFLPESGVDRATVSKWIKGILDSIEWARYQYWTKRLGIAGRLKAIEVGCGYGKFSIVLGLSGVQTTLLDYNVKALEAALKGHGLAGLSPRTFVQDLLGAGNGLAGTFDIACSFGTLEHFSGDYRLAAFQSHVRFLKPGGLLFFTVPNKNAVFYRIAFAARKLLGLIPGNFFEQPFSREELRELALHSGVQPLEIEGTSTLKDDFDYWIMNNVKSAYRKTFRIKKKDALGFDDPEAFDALAVSNHVRDTRTSVDKMFTSPLLFVGIKQK